MALNTTQILAGAGSSANYVINVEGLDALLKFFKAFDPKAQKALQAGLKEAAQPVLTKARANAMAIADDGTFAASMSIRNYASAARTVLKSNDEAAGVKEFANPGAKYSTSSTDKRKNARRMGWFPVGVPHRANPPRAMIPAVDDSSELVQSRIVEQLDRVLGEVAS